MMRTFEQKVHYYTMMQFKVIIISALTFVFLGGQNASAECPDPWTDLGYLGCFHFAEESEFVNWYAAQHYCNDLDENAFLAEILDEETQLVLTALADELPDIGWWLGATDFYQVKCLTFKSEYFQFFNNCNIHRKENGDG